MLRDHPLCYQESYLPELLYVPRIRFGRRCTVRPALQEELLPVPLGLNDRITEILDVTC